MCQTSEGSRGAKVLNWPNRQVVGEGAGSNMISGKASGKSFCLINPDLNFISKKPVSWSLCAIKYLIFSSDISALFLTEQLNSTVMDTYVGLPRTLYRYYFK